MAYSQHILPAPILICDDDGAYYLRQLDARDGAGFEGLVWFGQSLATEPAWANVFVGRLRRNVRSDAFGTPVDAWHGTFFDVPKGRACGHGPIAVETLVVPPNPLNAICGFPEGYLVRVGGAGFGGRTWNIQSLLSGCWDERAGLPRRPELPPIYAEAMRRNPRGTQALVAGLGSAAIPAGFSRAEDLTGAWIGDDGGSYYLRHIPVTGDVVWYGESADATPSVVPSGGGSLPPRGFANVFVGRLAGSDLSGFWADVPRGATRGAGRMTLRQVGEGRLEVATVTGGFGGRRFWKVETLDVTVTVPRLTIELAEEDREEPLLYLSFFKLDGEGVDLDALAGSRASFHHPPSTLIGDDLTGTHPVDPSNSTYRTVLRSVRARNARDAARATLIGVIGYAFEVDEGYPNEFRRERLTTWRASQEVHVARTLAGGALPDASTLRSSANRILVRYLGPWEGWPWGDPDDTLSGDVALVSLGDLAAALRDGSPVLTRSMLFQRGNVRYRADVEFSARSRLNPACSSA